MSDRYNDYRRGNDWKSNFHYLNYQNVSAALRKILNTREPMKIYDRFGNIKYSLKPDRPLSQDETIFRIMVLLETQMKDYAHSQIPLGDYDADRKAAKALAHGDDI